LRGHAGQQRAAKCVRLDGHHDDMLAVAKRRKRMLDRRGRIARRLDDDVDRRVRHQRLPVLREVSSLLLQSGIERRGGVHLAGPADALQVLARVVRRKVRDAHQMHPWRARHLGDVHRAELAGADHADA
jgi:hypothetical protein